MARGGVRPGSGRPKGAASVKTREIADKAAEEGITPLEVMLQTMRELWAAQDKLGACNIAEKAAPYLHAKLQSVDASLKASGAIAFYSGVPDPDPELSE